MISSNHVTEQLVPIDFCIILILSLKGLDEKIDLYLSSHITAFAFLPTIKCHLWSEMSSETSARKRE
jgi:hypothetical protein